MRPRFAGSTASTIAAVAIFVGATVLAASATAGSSAPALNWETRHSQSPGDDGAFDLAADRGSVFAGGLTTGPGGDPDLYVGAFDSSTGSPRWQVAPASPSGADIVNAVAAAGHRVFAGGRVFDSVTRRDAYLGALDSRTGQVLWEDRRDLAARADEVLAVDTRGNRVVAAGYGGDCAGFAAGDCDLFVRSYDASSGDLLWEDLAAGGASDFDVISAVVVRAGRVFATGGVAEPGSGPDFLVRAYRLSDGALLWQDRYDQSLGFDAGGAIAYKAGTVVAAGASSSGQPGPTDATIRAYRAADGKVRWTDSVAAAGDLQPNLDVTGGVLAFSGASDRGFPDTDFVVRGYGLLTGRLLWDQRVDTPGGFERSLDVLGVGRQVWAAGTTGDCDAIEISVDCRFAVRAYAARSGRELFADDVSDDGENVAFALTHGSGRVFAGGLTSTATQPADVLLRAYRP